MTKKIPGPYILTAGRKRINLPLDDPELGPVLREPKNLVPCLLKQINHEEYYDFPFRFRRNLTFVDLGAYMGFVSMFAQDVCGRVVAVEPSPMFSVLEKLCAPYKNIEPVRIAIAGENGEVTFHLNDVNPTASSVVNTYGEETKVPACTLWQLLCDQNLARVDFCKVDIEGSEGEALTLEQVTLAKDIIQSYYVEVHNCPKSTWEQKLHDLIGIFIRVGYKHMKIRGDSVFASYEEV